MKKTLFVPVAFAAMAFFVCNSCKNNKVEDNDSTNTGDSIKIEEAVDSTLWGRIGEGSGMSVVEFISDKGDTMYLRKESEDGTIASMLGSLRNNTDRFAVTVANAADPEAAYLLTCVNVTELMGVWKNKNLKLSIFADGAADCEASKYTGWKMINGKLVFTGTTTTEYGETARVDTMIITQLDEDSLKYMTPQHEEIKLGR